MHAIHCSLLWCTPYTAVYCDARRTLQSTVMHAVHCSLLWCTPYTAIYCDAHRTLQFTAMHAVQCSLLRCTLYTAVYCDARCSLQFTAVWHNNKGATANPPPHSFSYTCTICLHLSLPSVSAAPYASHPSDTTFDFPSPSIFMPALSPYISPHLTPLSLPLLLHNNFSLLTHLS